MDLDSILKQLATHQSDFLARQNSSFLKTQELKNFNWVCAVGKHKDVWDYMMIDTFDNCLNYGWGVVLQKLSAHCQTLSTNLTHITLDKKATGPQIVKIVKKHHESN